jgi:hypothetical protein
MDRLEMSRARSRPARWLAIARELQEALPGEWSLRGSGGYPKLVREPVEWTIPWIAYGRSASGGAGWLFTGVLPLMEPFMGWHLKYGLRMDTVRRGPRSIDLAAPEAAGIARDFALGPALDELRRWPLERLAEVAELDFDRPREKRDNYWFAAAGCRVIFDSGSLEEPAAQAAARFRDLEIEGGPEFYDGLAAAWRSGGRAAAMEFLGRQRDRLLAQEGMDKLRS